MILMQNTVLHNNAILISKSNNIKHTVNVIKLHQLMEE